ncbi:MAG: S8 family serine peptidase [Thermoleophilia bacterium]|nr:S8 family serine peptidase [Thermoleophilia bacterium]
MNERESTALDRRTRWLEGPDSPIGSHDDERGGYFYAKDELLVVEADFPRLERVLAPLDIKVDHDHAGKLGVVRLRLGSGQDASRLQVPEILARVRAADQPQDRGGNGKQPALRVGPNHVLSGEPEYEGGPYGPARPSVPEYEGGGSAAANPAGSGGRTSRDSLIERLMRGRGRGKGVRVVVIDTGYTRNVHPVMDQRVRSTGTPELDAQPKDGQIDYEAGHGTFVAGCILRHAPCASVEVVEVLGPAGYGTEHDIAQAILDHPEADVINLSLGGYTDGDHVPWSLNAALQKLRPQTAVVAAAGNNGASRPMWPAAFKRVVSVGAVDDRGQQAPFSNFGWWVDVCTSAVDVVGPFPRYNEQTNPGAVAPFFDGWALWSGTSFAAPKVAGEIAARCSLPFRYASARAAGSSLINDPKRPHLPDLGTLLDL